MDPLPDGTRLFHIGPPKTGSTAIQAGMHRSRKVLAGLGVHYAGAERKPRGAMGLAPRDLSRGEAPPADELAAWRAYRDDVVAHADARVVVLSREGFSRATDDRVLDMVRDVGGDRPHVVAVGRRLDQLMPSFWQQRVKRVGLRQPLDEWLRVVLDESAQDEVEWRGFWFANDLPRLVRRWTAAAGEGSFTLLVAPEGDRSFVPRALGDLLGVPGDLLEAEAGVRNQSLTHAEAELVRSLNVAAADAGWSRQDRIGLVRETVVRALMATPSPPGQDRVPVPPRWARQRLAEVAAAQVEELRLLEAEVGLRIGGDLDVMVVPDPPADAPEEMPTVDLVPIETAVVALQAMGREVLQREVRARKAARARAAGSGGGQGDRTVARRGVAKAARVVRGLRDR